MRGSAPRAAVAAASLALAISFVSPHALGATNVAIVVPAVGGEPWTPDGVAKLDADLDAMLATPPALHGAHYGIYAIDTATGNVLYAHNVDDEVQPASTLKLVVGSVALDTVGSAFRFRTRARMVGSQLAVSGGYDPTFTQLDVATLVAALHPPRVSSIWIDGADESHRSSERPYPDGWTWDDFGEDYAAPISSFSVDENVVDVRVRPSAGVDGPAMVSADSATIAVSSDGCNPATDVALTIVANVMTGRAGSDDTVDAGPAFAACPSVVGSIPSSAKPETIAVSVDPYGYARASLRAALRAAGVSVNLPPIAAYRSPGTPASGYDGGPLEAPSPAEWTHDSAPLGSLLGPRFWVPSDNFFGENLLRELGAVYTTDAGLVIERRWLQSIGVDPATVTLADGCGMSQYDRITPRDLVTILQHDWNGTNRQLVLDSLPVGGARGTIEGIAGTDAAGRVIAKTGSMRHVRGLAGYLATKRHGAVTFAFAVDDWNGDYPSLAALRARVLSRLIDD